MGADPRVRPYKSIIFLPCVRCVPWFLLFPCLRGLWLISSFLVQCFQCLPWLTSSLPLFFASLRLRVKFSGIPARRREGKKHGRTRGSAPTKILLSFRVFGVFRGSFFSRASVAPCENFPFFFASSRLRVKIPRILTQRHRGTKERNEEPSFEPRPLRKHRGNQGTDKTHGNSCRGGPPCPPVLPSQTSP